MCDRSEHHHCSFTALDMLFCAASQLALLFDATWLVPTRWFWVSWRDRVLSVGRGLTAGTGAFLEYREGLNHTVRAATLYGSSDAVLYHVRSTAGARAAAAKRTSPWAHSIRSAQTSVFLGIAQQNVWETLWSEHKSTFVSPLEHF